MTGSTGAGSDSKDDGRSGDSATDKGSQGGDGNNSGDSVPKTQFLAALKNAEEKRQRETAALHAENERLRAAAEQAKAKPPTRAELQELVESGGITQAQADAAMDKQVAERAAGVAAATVDQRMSERQQAERIDAELRAYRELVPEVWQAGTEERVKVEQEFNHLISLGQPNNQATEAAAVRAAFGPVEILRVAKSSRPGPADTHAEVGGGSRPGDGGGKKDVIKSLSPDKKSYYQRQIDSGRYKDWSDVRKELEFTRQPRKSA